MTCYVCEDKKSLDDSQAWDCGQEGSECPYCKLVGKRVSKSSRKPFKCGEKINTVKAVIEHPILFVPAFTFIEDESFVECRQCVEVTDEN